MRESNMKRLMACAMAVVLACGLSPMTALAAGPGGAGGGSNTSTYDYTGTYSGALVANGTNVTSSGKSYTASTADQNAALCENAGTLTIVGDTFSKSGDDTNGDNCNFYGCNSILLGVNSGSTTYVSDSSLSATSQGSNGIFATDSATVNASNDTISTTSSNSRGLDATYDGTIIANLMSITTQADHCAALATDRGGGNISCTNSSTLSTAGSGSPLIYSTGDIEVDGCEGTASGSQIAGMEGLNNILIYNSTLSSTCNKTSGSDPVKDGVILYQSTSGDADTSTGSAARFDVCDSTLSTVIDSGAFFYCTNTTANVVLSGTTLDYDSDAVDLIEAVGNDSNNWGTAGSNGATINFTGLGETLSGNAVADTISTLKMYLLSGTTWTGAASITTNSAGSTSSAPLSVSVDGDSTWVVSGDSTVTNLSIASGGSLVDANGNTVKVVNSSGTTLRSGTSSVTVTVTGSYSTSVATSSVNALSTDYIDRTAFDSYYGTSTTFGNNGGGTTGTSIASATVSAISSQAFTGSAFTPEPTVTLNDTTLAKDTDYTLSYSDNIYPGTATVTIKGAGSYSGTKKATFSITSVYTDFTDVTSEVDASGFANIWYAAGGWLDYVVSSGLMSGYTDGSGDFGPYDSITRGQVATVLYRYACSQDSSLESVYGSTYNTNGDTYATTASFPDESTGVYYTAAINWAKAVGILTGDSSTSCTTVRPDDAVQRQELCVMLARFAQKVEGASSAEGSVDYSAIQGMDDVDSWATDSVDWCASYGIIGGVNSGGVYYMNPTDPTWRASMAKMITVVIRDVISA